MVKQPLITVVIPTRSRAALLRYALRSALEQTYDDYEVIVSNNNSGDDTEQVVQEFAHERLRYVKTAESLSMPDHYEFALGHVRGRYVTYLGDDDALVPHCLEKAAAHINTGSLGVVCWSWANYHHSTWFEEDKHNTVTLSHYTFSTQTRDAAATLKRMFHFGRNNIVPLITNGLYPLDLITRLKSNGGNRFFAPPAPDFTSCAAVLASLTHFFYIDEPFLLSGYSSQSIGAGQGYNRSSAAQTFEREFRSTIYADVPLQCTTTNNVIAQSLIEAKRRWPALLANYEIDWRDYFLAIRENLDTLARNGVDVREANTEFARVVATQFPYLRYSPRVVVYPVVRHAKRLARSTIRRLPSAVQHTEARVRPLVASYTIAGNNGEFADIVECAQRLPALTHAKQ